MSDNKNDPLLLIEEFAVIAYPMVFSNTCKDPLLIFEQVEEIIRGVYRVTTEYDHRDLCDFEHTQIQDKQACPLCAYNAIYETAYKLLRDHLISLVDQLPVCRRCGFPAEIIMGTISNHTYFKTKFSIHCAVKCRPGHHTGIHYERQGIEEAQNEWRAMN